MQQDTINPTPQPRSLLARFRPRFSLRTMLAVITVVCILIPTWILPSERQRRAANQIEAAGGSVKFSYEHIAGFGELDDDFRNVIEMNPTHHAWYEHYWGRVEDVSLRCELGTTVDWVALPHIQRLDLTWINHGKQKRHVLADLPANPKLKFLYVSHGGKVLVNNNDVSEVEKFGNLETLVVVQTTALTDDCWKHVRKLKKLKILELDGHFSPDVLENLTSCPNLERLCYSSLGQPYPTPTDYVHLRKLRTLKQLKLDTDDVGDKAFASIGELTNLEQLRVGYFRPNQFTDTALSHLSHLKKLKSLILYSNEFDGTGAQHLASLTQLKELQLDSHLLNDKGLSAVGKLKQVRDLTLFGDEYSESGVKELLNMNQLEQLNFGNAPITDNAIIQLKAIRTLKRIYYPFNEDQPLKKETIDAFKNSNIELIKKD